MTKVVRDGQVAVVYSPEYGAGWYSWNPDHPEILFDPAIVDFVEKQQWEELQVYVTLRYPDVKHWEWGLDKLKIEWIPQGTFFQINEYDGAESIECQDRVNWIQA